MGVVYNHIEELRKKRLKGALCLIVETKGSAPRKAGTKMLVKADGKIAGSIGGGDLEKKVIGNALEVIKKKRPQVFHHDLLHQHSMCCGGSVTIYIEPIMTPARLYIFGAGHTGSSLAKIGIQTGFEVFVIDERKEYLDSAGTPGISKLNLHHSAAIQALPFDENTYIAVATYNHAHDREILAGCVNKTYAYLGMIGSNRKVELTKKMFLESGIATADVLEKIRMPMGINIRAESPEEIAVSIMAEMIAVKNECILK